jgi:hypothetical protein
MHIPILKCSIKNSDFLKVCDVYFITRILERISDDEARIIFV